MHSLPDRSRILITGGAGFIGCRLAHLASAAGHDITVTSAVNSPVEKARMASLVNAGIPAFVADVRDPRPFQNVLPKVDVVIHLAAAQHEAHAGEEHFRSINVSGTLNLLSLASQCAVRRFVYGSTIGVYGRAAPGCILDESTPLAPENDYGRSKVEAERLVLDFADRMETCIGRISETYGPFDMRLLKLFRLINRGVNIVLGPGTNHHQPIYVDDLALALLQAATAPRAAGETFNLARSEQLTTIEMAVAISSAVGCTRSLRHVPLWPFTTLATLMEGVFPRLGLPAPMHSRKLDFFRTSFRLSTAKAQELLEFSADTGFREGAARTALWYRANGYL